MNSQITVVPNNKQIFEVYESEVRSYCRNFEKIFTKASGSFIFDEQGDAYLDFLSCAGALNYGHNHPVMKQELITYVDSDGIQGALDLHTQAKKEFIECFNEYILKPRDLPYKIQFTSPTGTSVVESAVKLARKVTKRQRVVAFTNGYHGMTGTSLGLTGNKYNRQPVLDNQIDRLPYDQYFEGLDSLELFKKLLEDNSSGQELPAAVIVETIQGEGGIKVASSDWLQRLRKLTIEKDIILIIDDIQAGCGRTGTFFSFEHSGIKPDMVCMSKSLSGYGYPLSVLLMANYLDQWSPGEDNGTFRGNSLAMVTAKTAVMEFWKNDHLSKKIEANERLLTQCLESLCEKYPESIKEYRGRGMMYGIEFFDPDNALRIAKACFENNLIVERCGNEDQVVKLFPPLTIEEPDLVTGLDILSKTVISQLSTVSRISTSS